MVEFAIAGAVISAYSAYQGSRASSRARDAQAAIARWQAEIALFQAKQTARVQLKAGHQEAVFRRRESRRATGAAVVRVGGSGVELAGSPLARIGADLRRDELNAAQVVTNANARASSVRARGRGQAVGFRASAASLNEQARITRVTGWLEVIGIGMSAVGGYYAQTSRRGPTSTPGGFTFDTQYGS